MQQFSYNPNHPANSVIHFAGMWGTVFQDEMAKKYLLKYAFEYERIGGTDPFGKISIEQMNDMTRALRQQGWRNGFTFVVDWAGWMSGEDVAHYPYPRYMYKPPSGKRRRLHLLW